MLVFKGKSVGGTEIRIIDDNGQQNIISVNVAIQEDSVTLSVGKSEKVAVLNGTYNHQVISADPTIASVLYEGPITGSMATIKANYPGITTIEVKNPSGNVAQIINVTVTGTVTEPDQETLTINDDYSFFVDAKFDLLGIIQIMRAQFEFIGEQNGKMLWKLAGPPMKKTTETGDEVELGMDYSFEIPYAESSYGNFKLKFEFYGEQNGNYLWELVYLELL